MIIATDIGGSKIKTVLLNKDLDILDEVTIKTNASKGKKEVINNLIKSIKIIKDNYKTIKDNSETKRNIKIKSIGISVPGIIKDGKIIFGGKTLHFLKNTDLKKIIEKEFKITTKLINDADAFTLAESILGIGQDYKKICGLIWGSGIGSSLIIKTEKDKPIIISGSEIGHIKLTTKESIEDIAGGLSVEKKYFKLTKTNKTLKEIYNQKDKLSKQLIKEMIKGMVQTIIISIQAYNPEIILIGGGVTKIPLIKELKNEVRKNLEEEYAKKTIIKKYSISTDAGIFGAGIIALQK